MRLSVVLVALCACHAPEPTDSAGVGDYDARIEISPLSLVFEDVIPGQTARDFVIIRSVGADPALLQGVEPLLSEAFTITGDRGTVVLSPGEEVEIEVTYTPTEAEHHGWLAVRTDDPDKREVLVDLYGGVSPGELLVTPEELDFGNVLPGGVLTLDVTLDNVGGTPITVDQWEFDPPLDVINWTTDLWSGELQGGDSAAATITFAPPFLQDDRLDGTLWLHNSGGDPVEVPIFASSQNTPLAICEAAPPIVHAWQDTADFLGSGSYNPEGGDIVSYEWTLISKPAGSAQELPEPLDVPDLLGFRPDLAGEYIAELVVTNEMGVRSEPCEAVLTATVGDDLWIELFWEESDDDMDIHLIRAGGSMFSNGDDCHWDNCQYSALDWGDPASLEDDPSLDFDDIFGTGPENINILRPADGVYEVWVHDYPASEYFGDNNVTVNVYVFGQLEYTSTIPISGEDSQTHFADVTFPGGSVSPAR